MQEAIDAEEFGTDALRKTIAVALQYVADPAISAVLLPKLSSKDPSVSFAEIIAALPMDDKAAIQDALIKFQFSVHFCVEDVVAIADALDYMNAI
jgi:hypothetical protein